MSPNITKTLPDVIGLWMEVRATIYDLLLSNSKYNFDESS